MLDAAAHIASFRSEDPDQPRDAGRQGRADDGPHEPQRSAVTPARTAVAVLREDEQVALILVRVPTRTARWWRARRCPTSTWASSEKIAYCAITRAADGHALPEMAGIAEETPPSLFRVNSDERSDDVTGRVRGLGAVDQRRVLGAAGEAGSGGGHGVQAVRSATSRSYLKIGHAECAWPTAAGKRHRERGRLLWRAAAQEGAGAVPRSSSSWTCSPTSTTPRECSSRTSASSEVSLWASSTPTGTSTTATSGSTSLRCSGSGTPCAGSSAALADWPCRVPVCATWRVPAFRALCTSSSLSTSRDYNKFYVMPCSAEQTIPLDQKFAEEHVDRLQHRHPDVLEPLLRQRVRQLATPAAPEGAEAVQRAHR